MFVYHFVDPDLRVEIIFRKEERSENWGIEFNIGYRDNIFIYKDIGTSHTVLEVEEMSCRACLLYYYFFGDKNSF